MFSLLIIHLDTVGIFMHVESMGMNCMIQNAFVFVDGIGTPQPIESIVTILPHG